MKKLFLLISVLVLLPACATVIDDATSVVYVGAYDANGDPVAANCIVSNDEGTIRTRSNRHVTLRKDKDEIKVSCTNKLLTGDAVNREASVSGGYWAVNFFLIDLCLISCWIDGFSGSWVNMPTHIEVPMDAKEAEL